MYYIQPLIGAAVILGIGYVFSNNRRAITIGDEAPVRRAIIVGEVR